MGGSTQIQLIQGLLAGSVSKLTTTSGLVEGQSSKHE